MSDTMRDEELRRITKEIFRKHAEVAASEIAERIKSRKILSEKNSHFFFGLDIFCKSLTSESGNFGLRWAIDSDGKLKMI